MLTLGSPLTRMAPIPATRSPRISTPQNGKDPLKSFLQQGRAPGGGLRAEGRSRKAAKKEDDVSPAKPGESMVRFSMAALAVCVLFGGIGLVLRGLVAVFPPDFADRWRKFVEQQAGQELKNQRQTISPTVLYDRRGTVIATIIPGNGAFSGRQCTLKASQRAPLRREDIPSALWQAVVASEDRRFFEHRGVDPRGICRAILSLASSGGGSTITQQLVKNLFLANKRSLSRKFVEILLALVLETQVSKWDILHAYLEKIYWGHGMYGIEEASEFYFGKHPSMLTVGECAMLAGIIPAPELLSPLHDSSRGKKPQSRCLRRMVEAGFLDIKTATTISDEPLVLIIDNREPDPKPWKAPYFVSEVLYELRQTYGQEKVLQGGLQVHTTVDLAMQEIAEKVVRDGGMQHDQERSMLAGKGVQRTLEKLKKLRILHGKETTKAIKAALERIRRQQSKARPCKLKATNAENVKRKDTEALVAVSKATESTTKCFHSWEKALQASLFSYHEEYKKSTTARTEAAVAAIDPMNGAVRILVGGRDYYESSFNRCTQAYRRPGSTFKPIVYLAALEEGLDRHHLLVDEPLTIGGFFPENYDRKFRGKVTLEESLLKSLNVPTVKLCAEIGVDKVCRMGKALGIETALPYELSLSLGGCEVTPLQLATVYSTIASGGFFHRTHLISHVTTSDGRILEETQHTSIGSQIAVVDQHAVLELRKLLQAVVERGTGRAAKLKRPCGGKTGTSDGYRDVWFSGFTPQLACVVWLGYDDNSTLGGLHPATGASHAAPVWRKLMDAIHMGMPVEKFHDIGRDQYGGRGPRPFERRFRKFRKSALKHGRKDSCKHKTFTWKDIWDWEKASAIWEEREKMHDWAKSRLKRTTNLQALQELWQKIVVMLGIAA